MQRYRIRQLMLRTAIFTCLVLPTAVGTAWAFPVQIASAPENNHTLSVSAIRAAKKSIRMNIYQLTEQSIADAIAEKIREGVQVEILLEGQPLGGMDPEGVKIASDLVKLMKKTGIKNRFYEMTGKGSQLSQSASIRRYRYNHAKYTIIDGKSLLISSENYTHNGHPLPGATGNRGWEAFIHNSSLAQQFLNIFRKDADLSKGDVIPLAGGTASRAKAFFSMTESTPFMFGSPEDLNFEETSSDDVQGQAPLAIGIPTVEAEKAVKITSPDTSLPGLLSMIDNAKHTLDVEQMSFYVGWRKAQTESPLLTALVHAARRGVAVRVLLNDDWYYQNAPQWKKPETRNRDMVRRLNEIARKNRLPITARIANLEVMGVTAIHNKGVVADGERVLISSINWNENSITRNRETAVAMTSVEAAEHFSALFEKDWKASQAPSGDARQQHPELPVCDDRDLFLDEDEGF